MEGHLMYHLMYLTRKELNKVLDKIGAVKEVDISPLYEHDADVNSTKFVKLLMEIADAVESALFMPTDAGADNPPAYLWTKAEIEDPVKYVERKFSENKIVSICDSYECDYVIFK